MPMGLIWVCNELDLGVPAACRVRFVIVLWKKNKTKQNKNKGCVTLWPCYLHLKVS
jgi:hypothetical protein